MSKAGAIPSQCVAEVMERAQWASADKDVMQYKADYEKYLNDTQCEQKVVQKEPSSVSPAKTVKQPSRKYSFIPMPPDPEVKELVDQVKSQMKEQGIILPLSWQRVTN